jgi:hypothetical protein
MLKTTTLAGALTLIAAGAAHAQDHAPVKLTGIDWRTDLAAATREAKAAGKPLLVTFR